jgi:hypothetical protein
LLNLYQSLSIDNQKVFIRVFNYLWGCVVPASRFNGRGSSLHSFWAVDYLRQSSGLSSSLFSLLLFIYHITGRNKNFICSDQVYNNPGILFNYCQGAKQNKLSQLTKLGYLARSWSNPDQPYLQKSYRSRPVFIKLSPAGVQLIHDIEKDLYKLLLNTSLNDLTGVNKKPG